MAPAGRETSEREREAKALGERSTWRRVAIQAWYSSWEVNEGMVLLGALDEPLD